MSSQFASLAQEPLLPVFTLKAEESKFNAYYKVLENNKGVFNSESEEFIMFKNIFKEITVFRDIPN